VTNPWLSELLAHGLAGGGKRIRPALVLLSAKFHRYNLTYLLPMAVAIEVLHTATLVHDDAIDHSNVRRGHPTIYPVWGEGKAILLGDYLLAKAEELVSETQNLRVVRLFAQTIMTIASGEITQAATAFTLDQTREQYLERIAGKTASLISLATRSGAILSEAPEQSVAALGEYGYNLGIAFQIVDDILDFTGDEAEMGKPTGSDLSEGTLTLPAMLLLERYPDDRNPVRRIFQNEGDRPENIKRAIEMVRQSTVIEECYQVASDYSRRAYRNLELLPDNESRQALRELVEFVVARKK
jgi:geranylgeranyl pyrophosphate synthase